MADFASVHKLGIKITREELVLLYGHNCFTRKYTKCEIQTDLQVAYSLVLTLFSPDLVLMFRFSEATVNGQRLGKKKVKKKRKKYGGLDDAPREVKRGKARAIPAHTSDVNIPVQAS